MNDIFKTFLFLSLSGSIIAIILFAVKPFIKHRISKTWQYYIWLVVILRLFIPFTSEMNILNGLFNLTEINAIIPIYNVSTDYHTSNISSNYKIDTEKLFDEIKASHNVSENDIISGNTSSPEIFDAHLSAISAIQYNGWLLWLLISAMLLLKKIFSYHAYVLYIKSNRRLITDENIIKTYDGVFDNAGITRKIGIYSYKKINSPMLIGFLKPYILLPETMLKTTDGLHYILLHELTHYRRLDFLYKWFVQIAVCIHFFNPIVYFVRKEINKACEFSCDEMVIKKLDDQGKKSYGTALIDALEVSAEYNQNAIPSMLCEDVKTIKERLGAIMRYKRSSRSATVFTIFLTAMISLGAMFTGVSAKANITESKNRLENDLIMPTETEKYLQGIPAIKNATIDAYAYSGKWSDGKGFTSDTYKDQLDEKIKYIESIYKEKQEKFVILENVSEEEITDTMGIQYMFNNSSIYKNIVTITDSLFISSKDRAFTSFYSGANEYQRSTFYVDKPATLALKLDYTLSKGKLSIHVVSPNGEIVYQNEPSKQFDETINLSLDKGLWSIILLNEYENGQIYGTKGINGSITYPTEQIIINLPLVTIGEKKEYGSYELKKGDIVSANLAWTNTDSTLYFAIAKEFGSFEGYYHSFGGKLNKNFIVPSDGTYYVFLGAPSTSMKKSEVENISGDIIINGIKSAENKDVVDNLIYPTKQIDINLPLIEANGYSEYGPYDLKKGDVISSDLTWSNVEGGIYFAIGKEYYDFKGFHSTYGKWDEFLKKDIVVQEDGLYYIFVGNPSTDKPDVKNVTGKIMINRKNVSSIQEK